MRLLPNYFKTLGEGPVRERMPIASIDPLTSQSTAFEHNRSATESGCGILAYACKTISEHHVLCAL